MEIVAHSLWAAAGAIAARRASGATLHVAPTVCWAAFPDVLAFGPAFAAGLWLRLSGTGATSDGHLLPHAHLGLPLYPAGHSLIVFLLAFTLASLVLRRVVLAMLGWLLHILIDIPTHSFSYYATRFLWPISDFRVDGIAWWTPWFWCATYAALAVVFFALWRTGRWKPPLRTETSSSDPLPMAAVHTRKSHKPART